MPYSDSYQNTYYVSWLLLCKGNIAIITIKVYSQLGNNSFYIHGIKVCDNRFLRTTANAHGPDEAWEGVWDLQTASLLLVGMIWIEVACYPWNHNKCDTIKEHNL